MATAKKPAAKSAPSKTAPAKSAKPAVKAAPKTAAPKAASPKPIKTELNKTQLLAHLAESTGVELKTVRAVVAGLEATVFSSVAKKGAGSFNWPGVLKIQAVHVPAKKARKGIDPFTKLERTFAAKPASMKIKVRPLKKLKDAAA